MALNSDPLKDLMISNLTAEGFNTKNEHALIDRLTTAFAKAIVTHLKADAQVEVTGGSSSGVYKVS